MIFNRRTHEREVVTDCAIVFSTAGWKSYGYVQDISEGGMKVDIEEVPNMHEEVTISMTCDTGKKLDRKAMVIWLIKKTPPEVGALVGLKYI